MTDREGLFKRKVARAPSGCWIWQGQLQHNGYGRFWNGSKLVQAHRWAWEQWRGPIPRGFDIDHLCRVRRCVRPEHLQPVPHAVNLRRGSTTLGRRTSHCRRGHALIDTNVMVERNGKRRCLTCARESWRRSKTRRMEVVA